MYRTWAELYAFVDISVEKVLRNKALLENEVLKLSQAENNSVKKLQGELKVDR